MRHDVEQTSALALELAGICLSHVFQGECFVCHRIAFPEFLKVFSSLSALCLVVPSAPLVYFWPPNRGKLCAPKYISSLLKENQSNTVYQVYVTVRTSVG